MYYWTKNAYSMGGVYYGNFPTWYDVIPTIIPFLNTLSSVYVSFISVTGKKKVRDDFSDFFNVKK